MNVGQNFCWAVLSAVQKSLPTTNSVASVGTNLTSSTVEAARRAKALGFDAGMAIVPYIVLAVTAVPSIAVATGLPVLAVHMFVIFYLLTGGITPPVCVIAFTAAALAGAKPMKTGFTAMRLAVVLYFIPWFFVFNPALILEGPVSETIYLFFLCALGIWVLASGLEGYLIRVGRLDMWARVPLVAGGFMIALPGWTTTLGGAALSILIIAIVLTTKRRAALKLPTGGEST